MRQVILSDRCAVRSLLGYGSSALALAIALAGCSSAAAPLAIRMYNPKTSQTLHCTARSEAANHSSILASAVEACARQLEASGFVRD